MIPVAYITEWRSHARASSGVYWKGESAVLALALDLGAEAVLDDRNARRCAKALDVPTIGTFGVILRAKKRGLIDAAKPILRSVLDHGLYYDDDSVSELLAMVGESWP